MASVPGGEQPNSSTASSAERHPIASAILAPRLIAIAVSLVVGVGLSQWERGIELGHVLRYLALVAVSLFASQWLVLLLLNGVTAGVWLALVLFKVERFPSARRFVLDVNRQIGHVEALFAWTIITLVAFDRLWLRLPFAMAVALYGIPFLDAIAKWIRSASKLPENDPNALRVARRPLFYAATALGYLALVVINPVQAPVLFGLGLALLVGIGLRFWATTRIADAYRRATGGGREPWLLRPAHAYGVPIDRAVLVVMAFGVGIWMFRVENESSAHHAIERLRRLAAVEDCRIPSRSSRPDVSLFLVADNQFHELAGRRSGVQMDLIDQVVPVAQRPVELDLLSGATLARFADLYNGLRKERPDMLWAHLGDIGDVGCESELRRFGTYLKRFGAGTLAGIAPGNHDSTFFGNFVWHPDWRHACEPSKLVTKASSNQLLLDLALPARGERALSPHAFPANPPLPHRLSSALGARETALPTITRLGGLPDGTGVYGAFLDTSDYTGFGLGIAGIEGAVSSAQADWLTAALAPYHNSYLILFMHHPFDELTWSSRQRLQRVVAPFSTRLLGVISAHTHLAARRSIEINGHPTTEVIVGSVIDAPQEGALLEVYQGSAGHPFLVVRTVPSVSHEGLTCGFPREIKAEDCAALVKSLRIAPACGPLFERPDFQLPSPETPAEVRLAQQQRATDLRKCICRSGPSGPACPQSKGDSLDAAYFDGVYLTSTARKTELICLSWAGSVLQSLKHEGWRLNRALAYAFDAGSGLGPMVVDDEPAPTRATASVSR